MKYFKTPQELHYFVQLSFTFNPIFNTLIKIHKTINGRSLRHFHLEATKSSNHN
jgi:hypothetical protein